jgi:prophage antirepressor-like protein
MNSITVGVAPPCLPVFYFESSKIEIILIDEKPWFNASQVAKALGYKNPAEALRDNVSAKYSQQLDLGRRGSKPIFINEPGLYQLVMKSNLPSAEKFQDWVFEEVLPSIRKTGSYSTERKVLGAYIERVEAMHDQANQIPEGYWCVLNEASNLLIWVEAKLKYPVDKADLLDGSVGIHWSRHREDKPWTGDRIKFKYRFPDGRWCEPWCYQMKELEQFRYFLDREYKFVILPKYLESKYPGLVKA